MQREPGNDQSRNGSGSPMDDTYPGCAVAVLRHEQHGHQDPVGLRQMQRAAHQAGDAQHHADTRRVS